MSKEIRADYSAILLFPRAIEEWVPADHPARFIREFVDALDLKALKVDRGVPDEGRPGYAPDLLLKVWLYGYCFGIYQTRPLERACREHLSLIWLTGGHEPDHNTLWRFWSTHYEALRGLFTQSLRVAANAGLIGFVLHAVDGTKIQARASTQRALHKKDLERMLSRLDKAVERIEREIRDTHDPEAPGYALPEELQQKQRLREKVRDSLAQLEQAERDHLHPIDPDAQIMKMAGGKLLAYNAQAVTDGSHGLIVAADVTTEENDQKQLVPMLDQVKQNLGQVADQTVADAGYCTAESIATAEERGYPVLVSPKDDPNQVGPYHTSRFEWDAERDVVICPRGEALGFVRVRRHPDKPYPVRLYRCTNRTCPVRDACTQNKRGREIEISPHHDALKRQEAKRGDPQMKELLRKRKQIGELPFAIIKEFKRYRRGLRHGVEKMKTEWVLICTALNLMKIWRALAV